MKCEKVWYECNYCCKNLIEAGLINSDGYGGIRDDGFTTSQYSIDICDDPECYQKHLKAVKEQMEEDDSLLFYPLDIAIDEQGLEYDTIDTLDDRKYKVKWTVDDNWHKYQRKTLIKLLIPLYEKYVISGNGK